VGKMLSIFTYWRTDMTLNTFFATLNSAPDTIQFSDTIAVIEAHYEFTPTAFQNGSIKNEAGQNSGSCKLFSFAKLHELTEQKTLACFGDYYRVDVLQHPDAQDHQNIRNFMQYGWSGIQFDNQALTKKILSN
jgi:UDP-2,3-diacylglucosamine pyrophosphatase LpxH